MRQQDLVWVRIPFSDLRRAKHRPAVVVSNDAYNRHHPDIVVCAITSNLSDSRYKVPLAPDDVQGHLPRLSMMRADKILQVDKALIGRTFARVHDPVYDRLAVTVDALVRRAEATEHPE